jgi:hypothetical protein
MNGATDTMIEISHGYLISTNTCNKSGKEDVHNDALNRLSAPHGVAMMYAQSCHS